MRRGEVLEYGDNLLAWEMMILSSWPLEKHLPGISSFHALSRCGVHCNIHKRLRMVLLRIKITMAACKGRMKLLVMVIRNKKRQIETLVNMRVAKVFSYSPNQFHRFRIEKEPT